MYCVGPMIVPSSGSSSLSPLYYIVLSQKYKSNKSIVSKSSFDRPKVFSCFVPIDPLRSDATFVKCLELVQKVGSMMNFCSSEVENNNKCKHEAPRAKYLSVI